MQVLLVYAHPEPASFNGALRNAALETLAAEGHSVSISDLYALNFDPVAGPQDILSRENEAVFNLGLEQMHASQNNGFVPDLKAEIDKLMRADCLLLQFPMWWFFDAGNFKRLDRSRIRVWPGL